MQNESRNLRIGCQRGLYCCCYAVTPLQCTYFECIISYLKMVTILLVVLQQTFNRIKDGFDFGDGEPVLILTDEHYKKALHLARYSFTKDEPVNVGVGLEWPEELENAWMTSFRYQVSFMVVNKINKEVMGIRITRIEKRDENKKIEQIKDPAFEKYVRFMNYADHKVNFFDKYPEKECFYFFGLGVDEKYRNQGLAEKMMKLALRFLSNLGVNNIAIKGEGSSNFSKRVYEKCGFETLYDLPFTEYKLEDIQVVQYEGIHKSMKGYGIHMTNCNGTV